MVQELKFGEMVKLHDTVKRRLFYYKGDMYWRDSGKKAGWVDEAGYNHIRIDGKLYLEHRLIFLIHHCVLPDLIDHIDQNPSNNRVSNLRGACKKLNAINSGIPSNNKSGVKGVCWHKAGQKWTAQIKNDGVKIHLGSYNKLQDAVAARLKAEEDLWGDIR